jgi:hypothetical protein
MPAINDLQSHDTAIINVLQVIGRRWIQRVERHITTTESSSMLVSNPSHCRFLPLRRSKSLVIRMVITCYQCVCGGWVIAVRQGHWRRPSSQSVCQDESLWFAEDVSEDPHAKVFAETCRCGLPRCWQSPSWRSVCRCESSLKMSPCVGYMSLGYLHCSYTRSTHHKKQTLPRTNMHRTRLILYRFL